jgi:hypothetical protein
MVHLRRPHYQRSSRCRTIAGAVRVLNLDPVPRWAGPVGGAQPLRHNALKAHLAGLLEYRGAVLVGVGAEEPIRVHRFGPVGSPWGE